MLGWKSATEGITASVEGGGRESAQNDSWGIQRASLESYRTYIERFKGEPLMAVKTSLSYQETHAVKSEELSCGHI